MWLSEPVAKKADHTAYDVTYAEPNRRKCRVWNSHVHATTLTMDIYAEISAVSFSLCVVAE